MGLSRFALVEVEFHTILLRLRTGISMAKLPQENNPKEWLLDIWAGSIVWRSPITTLALIDHRKDALKELESENRLLPSYLFVLGLIFCSWRSSSHFNFDPSYTRRYRFTSRSSRVNRLDGDYEIFFTNCGSYQQYDGIAIPAHEDKMGFSPIAKGIR